MKSEYSPLPTNSNEEAPQRPRVKNYALPFLSLVAVLVLLGGGLSFATCDGKAGKHPSHQNDIEALAPGLHHQSHDHHGEHDHKWTPIGGGDAFLNYHGGHYGHGHGHSHGHGNKHHGLKHKPETSATDFKAALKAASCPKQPDALNVGAEWDPSKDADYAHKAAERLSRAVQINTVSTDDMPEDANDSRFDGHYEFAKFMESEYPSIYEHLTHEAVNVHGHLFTWQGKTEGKPIFLMAHEDTVPVNPETIDQWNYAPWSGEITTNATDDTPGVWIWGRGASDCKNSLVGILGAVEKLVAEGFQPERTVLIGYGFDEEIGGSRGAEPIKNVIEERYGADGVAFIIDEGFSGIGEAYGAQVASLGMAEKGSVSIKLTVQTLGGHSSVAPHHTGIGYMARFITALEDNPFPPGLDEESPYLKYLSCLAEFAPEFPKNLKKQVKNPKKWPALAQDLAASDRVLNAFLSTTTAVDLIKGGVKLNALPENVEAIVNHRIAFTSSVQATKQHYVDVLVKLAKRNGFRVHAFEHTYFDEIETLAKPGRHLDISVVATERPEGLEPAPITPGDSDAFAFIAGTVKAVFGKKTVVAPTGMFANTDTARTWSLTKHIYRFTPAILADSVNVHTVNERISLRGHLTTMQFYYKLLRNTEGWKSE